MIFAFFANFALCSKAVNKMQTGLHRQSIKSQIYQKLSSFEEGWAFVRFVELPDFKSLKEHGIKLKSNYMISKNYYKLYLTTGQKDILIKLKAKVIPLSSEEKIVNKKASTKNTNGLIISANKLFIPQNQKDLKFLRLSKTKYVVEAANIDDAIKQLSENSYVSTISPLKKKIRLNRFGVGRLLGGKVPDVYEGNYQIQRILHERGFLGNDQVVTIIDSGIDTNHTFFYDPDHEMKYNQVFEHRKIKYYSSKYADIFDDPDGHGSHVSGTAAGNAVCENNCTTSLYNGVAPEAKIAFIDTGFLSDTETLVDVPFEEIKEVMEKTGSKICSNSWGYTEELPEVDVEYDDFSYKNPDKLQVFANGNDGLYFDDSGFLMTNYYSTFSPASAKNVLSVGNVYSPYTFSEERDPNIQDLRNEVGPSYHFIVGDSPIQLILAPFGKDPMENRDPTITGDKFLMSYSNCDIINNLNNETKLVIHYGPKYTFKNLNCKKTDVPVFLTDDKEISNYTQTKFTIVPSVLPKARKDEFIDPTASLGPTILGCMKPEISAIGTFVKSAKPGKEPGHENLQAFFGTSMSTAMISGATALISEFFAKKNISPDTSLLKASIIASASPISGETRKISHDQGHGFANLFNLFDGRSLGVAQNILIKKSEHKVAKIYIEKGLSDLSIAMSYLDPAMSEDSVHVLFSDLNLYVTSPSGKTFYGNHRENDLEEHFSTSECVLIYKDEIESGEYQIHVIGDGFFDLIEGINFSVVASGPFILNDNILLKFEDAENCGSCGQNGQCVGNRCVCTDNFTGINCQIPILQMEENKTYTLEIDPLNYAYAHFKVKPDYLKAFLHISRKPADEDMISFLYVNHGKVERVINQNDDTYLIEYDESYMEMKPPEYKDGDYYITLFNNSPTQFSFDVTFLYNDSIPVDPTDSQQDGSFFGSKAKIIGVSVAAAVIAIIVVAVTAYFCLCRKGVEIKVELEDELNPADEI